MAKKLYIETHGCQMNEYDSSRMVDLLGEHQALEVTARAEDADGKYHRHVGCSASGPGNGQPG